ncbi:P-loop containing nucleoside triphosphate hydrolase protein [Vararia minispora EC-137]|uniref:P-loop containing nucleoside triphosphate hydrolase protein n=1 Tax=Vararia minispora EC-137 TaxID=1314806 RepID=A0ACB8QB09_9AGAM|nr:P-loop containing nucleoside triphosphate hydrolase protein [Vararia minispora EC-137]
MFAVLQHGKISFAYDGGAYTAYKATWREQFTVYTFYDIVFDGVDDSAGKALAAAVYAFGGTLREEIWVYQSATWKADKDLYKAVQAAEWDDVVLPRGLKEGLQRDVGSFFACKDVYDELGITWKRGILLLGPPGNGKTESIKALLKDSEYPVLYVKSFTTPYGPEYGVRSIFLHARKHSPCILVLEDLDAMVTPKVRSFFLNELDGLAANHGILTIATTNHPERIDDAILNRPSRFDVKYTFAIPDVALRTAFARKWIEKVASGRVGRGLRFGMAHEEVATRVGKETEGFSFAFMKELFVSFLLTLAHARSTQAAEVAPEDVLFKQVGILAAQIIKKTDGVGAKKAGQDKKEGENEEKEGEGEEGEDRSCWSPPEPVERKTHDGVQF